MSVYQKLQAARIKLQNTSLKKSGNNKFAGYQYFELGDFLPTVQSIFSELGLCGIVSFTADTATLRIVDVAAPEQCIEFTSPMGSAALKGCHEVQNIGAVETYQRRYLWVAAMEIVEHDALDASEPVEKPQAKQQSTQAKPALRVDEVCQQMHECGDLEELQAIFAKAYRTANNEQKTQLKTKYDEQKAYLTERKAA